MPPAFIRLCRFIAEKKGGSPENVANTILRAAIAGFAMLPDAETRLTARRHAANRYCRSEALDECDFHTAQFEAWCDAKLLQLRRQWQ